MLPLTFKKSILELLSVLSVWLVRYARNLHPWKSNKWNLTLARQASIDSPNWTRARLKFGKYEIWVALGKSSSNSVLAVSSINTDLGNWKIRVIYGSFRLRFFKIIFQIFKSILTFIIIFCLKKLKNFFLSPVQFFPGVPQCFTLNNTKKLSPVLSCS